MAVQFSQETLKQYQEILKRYPDRRAALMPTLWLAQKEFGYLSQHVMEYLADLMGLPPAGVGSTVSFYSMYYQNPMGKYHVQVCTNLPCTLLGAQAILRCLEKRLGVPVGETIPGGTFCLSEVECLASCDTAPMMQINEDHYENLTIERVLEIIDRLEKTNQ